ncbi:ras-related protein Rab-7L1-like [Physella acuta]|uniref:ras-related protein Rab-7L1-like n=1 Tax=Physella acuta TaxID=109671 RepID=UPI0027DD9005|nr:ras-related protein Rab-7L1-like [Physella acuta]XP_059167197.1 ras-related protein Rab-7L1-like [Physella acuta]
MTEVLFKVIIIGDPTVGKTSFVQKYVNDSFRRDYKMTIGVDFALKVIKWSDKCNIKLQLWDIAGQERFTSMTRVYYKDAHACLVMCDLTQKNTFQNSVKWKKDLDLKCTLVDGSPVPCLLLANKSDISDHREVTQDEIEELCREHDFIGWSETSVKDGSMIEESMNFLIEEMMAKHAELEGFSESFPSSDSNLKLGKDDGTASNSSKCPCTLT